MKKQIINTLSNLFPSAFAEFAYRQLTNPQIKKLREHELQVLAQADQKSIPFKGFDIQTYCWEGGNKRVLLIHGWEGQAGNFSDLIQKLLAADYTVYAFDGPSHGFSSRGETSLFEFTELVAEMIKELKIDKLVSHSFGGVATTYALHSNPNLRIEKYALLTTPDRFRDRIQSVSDQVGISKKVTDKLVKRLEQETAMDVNTLNVSDFVKTINVAQSLIIHDKNDRVIPIQQSQNVCKNWEVCDLIEIEGTGHFRILRTENVLDRVVEFLN